MASRLQGDEVERIRDRVGEAVFTGPEGLRDALETDPASYLRLVAAAAAASDEGNRLLRESVAGARRAGHSWDAMGGVLGVSRQAAQQRFRHSAAAAGDDAGRRVLKGVHAFNELEVLAAEGREGNHLVDVGPLFIVVAASDHPWEHRRLIAPTRVAQRRMETE